MEPKWMEWGRALQTLAQNGLAYSRNPFDIERFEAIRKIAAEILSTQVVKDFDWNVPCVKITDGPRFPWRGLMLDVNRHFYTKQEVKNMNSFAAVERALRPTTRIVWVETPSNPLVRVVDIARGRIVFASSTSDRENATGTVWSATLWCSCSGPERSAR